MAALLDENVEPWDLLMRKITPTKAIPLGTVLTLPATGSEWNNGLVISRRSIEKKVGFSHPLVYPKFSLLDPRYTLTLPDRQLRSGIYDAMTHCIDLFLTGQTIPLNDNRYMSVMRELVDISKEIFKKPASIEIHGRLICAASFALNQILSLGKQTCAGIHMIGHQLTVMYGIDHGASLAMVSQSFLRHFKKTRGYLMARCAERVFDIYNGTDEEKIDAFIDNLEKWILEIGHVLKVSEYTHQKVGENDVEKTTKLVMESMGNKPFGWNNEVTEEIVRDVLTQVII